MSSSIKITFGPDDEGVLRTAWDPWAQAHELVLNIGNGLFYAGDVEVAYVNKREVSFGTFHMGPGVEAVVSLALEFWAQFGGAMSAPPELAGFIRARFLLDTSQVGV
jgi:hypothetical protein